MRIEDELSAFLTSERARIARRFTVEARALGLVDDARARDHRAQLVDELERVVATRGEEAAAIFGERCAELGRRRFDQGARLADVGRELGALGAAIFGEWRRARGRDLPAELAARVASMVVEGVLGAAGEVARAERQSQAGARDAALRLALDRIGDGVRILDGDGDIAFANAAARRLYGAPETDLELAREALGSGRAAGPARRERRDQNGDERTLETAALPITDGERLAGAVEITRDLSGELRHAEELGRAEHELSALKARVRRLGQDRAMGDLAAGAALALNNELNAIALRLKLLRVDLLRYQDREGPPLARHLDAIETATRKSAALVGRLQELAARRPHGPPMAIDLNAAVLEALDLVRPELTAAATDRSVRVDARLGHAGSVLAPSMELRELLCALLVAARDALPSGGVLQIATLRERQRSEVRFSYAETAVDDYVELALEAARDSARRLGGVLESESSGGQLTHRLLLTRAAPAKEQPPRPLPKARVERGARRVLVVDDDRGNRETLVELLSVSGYQADAAATSGEALAAADARGYDAALLDLAMPEMNGWELARRLRAGHPELRLAIVTGWEPAVGTAAPTTLVEAVFRKPIDLQAIQAFLDERPAAHTS